MERENVHNAGFSDLIYLLLVSSCCSSLQFLKTAGVPQLVYAQPRELWVVLFLCVPRHCGCNCKEAH